MLCCAAKSFMPRIDINGDNWIGFRGWTLLSSGPENMSASGGL